jgi:hypothetical protein
VQANVVIDAHGNPLLADFGLSSIMIGPTSIVSASLRKGDSTARWMAPELCDADNADNQVISSNEADIYAFAMVVLEVFTGKNILQPYLLLLTTDAPSYSGALPFAGVPNTDKVVQMVINGQRPPRPGGADIHGLTDGVWGIVQTCWSQEPHSRLRAFQVVEGLEKAIVAYGQYHERVKIENIS